MSDNLMTPAEVSEYLSVKPNTLAQWRSDNTGPVYFKLNHLVRYKVKDLDAWIEQKRVKPLR